MKQFLSRIANLAVLIFYALKFSTSFSTFLFVFSPVFVYRWILNRIHLRWHPSSVGIVPPLSSIYVEHDGSLKSAFNLVAIMKLAGHIELETFVQRISSKIVHARDTRGGLQHPELQQAIRVWGGYAFWMQNDSFEVRTHILSYEQLVEANREVYDRASVNKVRDEEFCDKFAKTYVQQALRPGQSPWEMVAIQNVAKSHQEFGADTVIVFKFHHSLADGYATFNTIMKCADTPVPRYEPPLPSKLEQVVAKIVYPVLASWDMARLAVASKSFPATPWDKKSGEQARLYGKTSQLSMVQLKQISALYKIPFTAVLLGVLGQAIRRFMLQQGQSLPEFILCGIALPTPNHPEGLSNDWYFTYIKIPLRGKSQLDLVKYVAEQFPEIKRSTLYVTRQILHKLIFMLPIVWKWKTRFYDLFYGTGRKPWPTLLSSMPGPKETVVVEGRPLLEMSYIYSRAHGNPCLMTMLSYQNRFQIWFSVDKAITFGQGVEALMVQINAQFEELDATAVNNPLDSKF